MRGIRANREEERRIIAVYKSGESQMETARRTNTTATTVLRVLRRNGVQIRTQPEAILETWRRRHGIDGLNWGGDESFWNWLGGFVDGEGSFCVSCTANQGVLRFRFAPVVAVVNTDIGVCDLIRETLNGPVYAYTYSRKNRQRPTTHLTIHGPFAVKSFCVKVAPYLRLRRDAAIKLAHICDLIDQGANQKVPLFLHVAQLREELTPSRHRGNKNGYRSFEWFEQHFNARLVRDAGQQPTNTAA